VAALDAEFANSNSGGKLTMTDLYRDAEPPRDEIDASRGALVIEFGAPWCGHCQGAQTVIREVLGAANGLRHLKVEDGPGKPLGRSFKVKLWPTLVFLKDGQEVARVVRPTDTETLSQALAALSGKSDQVQHP
jgi:thioredoxin 1